MATASADELEQLIRAAAKVDWLAIAEALASHFEDKAADEAAARSVEDLAGEVAPIVAPYLLSALGASMAPGLGLVALVVPALALAIVEYKGGDADPERDANAYDGRGGRGN
jgi:hypothetical protein